MKSNKEKPAGQKVIERITDAQRYEGAYYSQSFAAYSIYSNIYQYIRSYSQSTRALETIDNILNNNKRSNVFYANVETLKGLIVPEAPNIHISLNPAKKVENSKENKGFYDTLCNILTTISKNVVDNMPPNTLDAFKLDYLITGRGVMWVNVDDEGKISIDQVRWQDFAMDPKPKWDAVAWVARRRLFTKKAFIKKFKVNKGEISGTVSLQQIYSDIASIDSYGDTTDYIELWEYWDRSINTCYWVSKQYKTDTGDEGRYIVKKVEYDEDSDSEFFLPTPEPPLLAHNGINQIPFGDVWNYIHELLELAAIGEKRANLVKSLQLRGYTDTQRAQVVNTMADSTHNGIGWVDDDKVVAVPGFTPNPQDPLIYYVDNVPRLQLLDSLQKEHEFLLMKIWQVTGISEQMRNVQPQDDNPQETATAIRLKTKFGSRRLKEQQNKLLAYWSHLLKILIHRIVDNYEIKDYKAIFSYKFRDDNKEDLQNNVFRRTEIQQQLQQTQHLVEDLTAQMQATPQEEEEEEEQPQQGFPQPINQPGTQVQQQVQQAQTQNQQLMKQNYDLSINYQQLRNEVTWDRIIKFFKKDKMVSFLVTAKIDDIEEKIRTDEKKNSDIMYMQTALGAINGLIQSVQQNAQFVDIYTSIFSMAMESFDQTKTQRDDIDKFIDEIKAVAKQIQENPPKPQPSPMDQKLMAEAAEIQAKAQLIQAQIQEIQAKMQQPEANNTAQELQMKHQHDMELQQAKIQADAQRAQEKIEADKANIAMKIAADKERYQEKVQANAIERGYQ